MRLKLFLLALITAILPMAAQTPLVAGAVVNSETGAPVSGATVTLRGATTSATTNFNGEFSISARPGTDMLIVTCDGFDTYSREISVAGRQVSVGTIRLISNLGGDEYYGDTNEMIYDESVIEDEEGSAQSVAALTGAQDNLYYSTASYNFGPMYFRFRGYQNEYQDVYLNGINMNDPIRGRFNFSSLMGLTSRAFRNKTTAIGLAPAAYGFGGLAGAVNYNTITDTYAPGFNGSVAYTNSNYMLRAMASYSTGMRDNGWAFTIAAIGRYAKEGVIDGTFYNSGGLFLSLEKQLNKTNSLTLTAFGGPTQRAGASATYQEVYDLVGSNLYNPNWGWYDGKKRSSRVTETFDPTAMLTWLYKGLNTTVNTSAAVKWTNYKQSAIQYFNAIDPRPDYYRNLPSYYQGTSLEDREQYDLYTELWETKNPNFTQINWDNLYKINQLNNVQNQTLPEDKKLGSSYILENRHSNMFSAMFNSYVNHRFNQKFSLQGGVSFNYSQGHYYKTIKDLLGGEFWVDVDPFSNRTIALAPEKLQNNMDDPNRRVVRGDKFGYDYTINFMEAKTWLQNTITLPHWDINYGIDMSFTRFYRDGKWRNGRAPNDSKGKSKTVSFDNARVKVGATYKLDGNNYFNANVTYGTRAPLADQVFIAPRVKNTIINNPESERDFAIDATYIWNYRRFRGQIGAFYTDMSNVTERSGFYDDRYNTYAIYALQGVRKVNKGVELALAYKITPSITASFAGTFSRFNYKNNPRGTRSFENGLYADTTQTVYLKNYYVGSTPQSVFNVGIDWAAPKSWFFNINGTWMGDSYVNLSPRYHEALPDLWTLYPEPAALEAKIKELSTQDKLKNAFVLNLSIGKLVYINNKVSLNFNLNINNILNNKDIVTYAYQQGRMDTQNYQRDKYPNKLTYAQGVKVFFNVGVRF